MMDKEKKERVFSFFEIFGEDDAPDEKKPWEMLEQLLRFIDIAWHTGNFLGKISIIFLVGWPIFLAAFAALGGGTTLTAILALMPFLTAVMMLSTFPIIDAAVLANGKGRRIFKWVMAIIGVELVIGIYLSVVPVSNDAGLVPTLILVLAAILVIQLSGKMKRIKTLLWIGLIVLTIVFIKGGRDKVLSDTKDAPQQTSAPAEYKVHNGYLVRTGEPQVVREADTYKKISRDGDYIEIETDCVKFLSNMVSINPGEKTKVMHMSMFPNVRRNQCAYSITGDALPITGKRDRSETTLPWIRENLPHPEFPAGVLVFFLKDSTGVIAKDYIRDEGGYVILQNIGMKEATLHADHNTPPQFKNQVGFTGDTATISIAVQK